MPRFQPEPHHRYEDLTPRQIRATPRWKALAARLKKELPPICHICHRPINTDLPGIHRWGAGVDHLVPLARGGQPFDLDNLALAHNRCNALKGTQRPRRNPPAPRGASRAW